MNPNFEYELKALGGFWKYEPGAKYLALLASGKVSDVFVNTGVLTTRPDRLEFWAHVLAREISSLIVNPPKELCVIGPGMGGITLAYEVAKHLHTHTGTRAFFTEPVEENGVKNQKMRFDFPAGCEVLLTEDVITTGASVQKMFNGICEKGGFLSVLQIVGCLVDRRTEKGFLEIEWLPKEDHNPFKMHVVSLLSIAPRTWDTLADAQKDCPDVIEAIKPKANWKKLVEG